MSTKTSKYSLIERLLAYAAVAIISLAVLAFLTTLVVALVADRRVLADGMWPIVVFFSYWGLPFGFVLVMTLLGISFARRGRQR